MSTAGPVCAENATEEKTLTQKRKTDQPRNRTSRTISQLTIPTKFIPLLPNGEKLGLGVLRLRISVRKRIQMLRSEFVTFLNL
jgi:hypothetical protein